MPTPALILPPFLPNLYDLAVMFNGNPVIVADHQRFSRKSRVHRGRIRTPDGESQWLTLPIPSDERRSPLHSVTIADTSGSGEWIKQLTYCYSNAPYFDFLIEELKADLSEAEQFSLLTDVTGYIFSRLARYLELPEISMTKASQMKEWDDNPDQLARNLNASEVYQEHRSRHYLRQAECRTDPDVHIPEYRQTGTGFVPWCCLFDLLFEYGPEAFRITDLLFEKTGGQEVLKN